MGRAPRNDVAGQWYHVMNRGADRQDIFTDDHDHRRFEALLGEIVGDGLLEIHAYCWMRNHFHQLVRSPGGDLSTGMHRLGSEYARWYNDRHRRDGPLFRSRFRSVGVCSDEQLTTVARYIHRNPLSIVPRSALAAYAWSSYGVYRGKRARPAWLRTDELQSIQALEPDAYRCFVETDVPSDNPLVPRREVGLDEIEAVTATVAHVTIESLRDPTNRRVARARQMAIMLAVELRAASTEDLARRFGFGSAAAVRVAARRGRVRAADDPNFATFRDSVLARLDHQSHCYAVPGTA